MVKGSTIQILRRALSTYWFCAFVHSITFHEVNRMHTCTANEIAHIPGMFSLLFLPERMQYNCGTIEALSVHEEYTYSRKDVMRSTSRLARNS